MEKSYQDKIELHTDTILELLLSMQRIGVNKLYYKLAKEYGMAIDEEIDNWVNQVLNTINEPMKELLEFYFNDDGYFGLGLAFIVNELQVEKTFENFITYIEKLLPEKICSYLLLFGCEDQLREDFFSIKQEERLFDIIEEYFTVSSTGKWRVFKILSKPELVKNELLSLLQYYYHTFYQKKQDEVDQFITQYIIDHQDNLKQSFINSVFPVLAKGIETDLFTNQKALSVHISYFTEWGSYFYFEKECLVIGYRYPEIVQIWGSGNQGLLSKLSILKVLADETRLKILLQMNQGPKYLTELADTLGFSTPAVKYHLEKFLTVSLIQIEKSGNKIYYTLNKVKFKELISELKHSFSIK